MPPKTETINPQSEVKNPEADIEVNHEIAHDISADSPWSQASRRLLNMYGVRLDNLDADIKVHKFQILGDMDHLDIAMALSHPDSVDPITGYQDEVSLAKVTAKFAIDYDTDKPRTAAEKEEKKKRIADRKKEAERFALEYDAVRRDPVGKMAFDTRLAEHYLRRLGPTNSLRRKDFLDAGFELAEIRHLLDRDYDNLPEAKKRPELLMLGAIITEELALLWNPALFDNAKKVLKAKKLPANRIDLIGTVSDRNALDDAQIDTLPEDTRWKLIGAELSREAHEKFQAIAESRTAPVDVALKALARSTDMKMRELRIRAMAATNETDRNQFYSEMTELALWHEKFMKDTWKNRAVRREMKAGPLFELYALAKERAELHHGPNGRKQIIRLALPREDNVHEEIRPVINRANEKINISTDIIVEDINGNFAGAYQVKAQTRRTYEQEIKNRPEGNLIYPSERIAMRFLDDYELTRT